jgi:aspartate/methionine/tyrosine aminotransferase
MNTSISKFVKESLVEQEDSPIRIINKTVGEINFERKQQGFEPVPNLSMGIPNFPPSDEMVGEIAKRMSDIASAPEEDKTKFFTYQSSKGNESTQSKITEFYNKEYPESSISNDNVMIFNGATQFATLMFSSINNQKNGNKTKIAVYAPYFSNHKDQVEMNGKEFVPIHEKERETPASALARTIDENKDKNGNNLISMLLLSYPNNPTGNYYSKDELKGIMDVVENQGDMMLGVEKLYDKIAKNPEDIVFPMQLDSDYHEKVPYFEATSLSKSYSMPGSHVSYGFGSKELMEVIPNIALKSINSLSAEAENTLRVVIDFDIGGKLDDWKQDMSNHYLERVAILSDNMPDGFQKHPMVSDERQGSFYITMGAPDWIGKQIPDSVTHKSEAGQRKIESIREKIGKENFESGSDIAQFLLQSESAAVVSLDNFGLDEPYFRVSCAVSKDDITRARDAMSACNKGVMEGKEVIIESIAQKDCIKDIQASFAQNIESSKRKKIEKFDSKIAAIQSKRGGSCQSHGL